MAVKASASVTLMAVVDVASTKRYYRLQSSTATVPTKPTANPPSGWQTTEPSYQEGSTMSLYTTDQTIFSDGTFSYSDVSLSSSYEASKVAYNKAVAAAAAAADALGKLLFGTSATASSTVAKVVNGVTGFTLANGVSVAVTFTNANLAAAPTLNVNGSGAKPIILYGGTNIFWEAKGTVVFVYNGTSWVCNSTPVYASESTIGDPANSNVHIGKDSSGASTIDFRQAATIVAQMQANKISLGMNSAQSVIDFCQAAGEIGVLDSFLTFFGDLIAIRGEDSVVVASTDNASVAAGNATSTRRSSFIADTFINQSDFGSTAQMESYLKEISDPTKNKQARVTTTANNSVPAEARLDALLKKDASTAAKTSSISVFAQESGSGVNISGDEIRVNNRGMGKRIIYNTPIWLGSVGDYTSDVQISEPVTNFDFILVDGVAAIGNYGYPKLSIVIAVPCIEYFTGYGDAVHYGYNMSAFQTPSVYASGNIVFTSATKFRAQLDSISGWDHLAIKDMWGISIAG